MFAVFRIEPDGAARKSRRVEIALRLHALEIQHGAQAIGGGLRLDGAGKRLRRRAVRHRFRHHPADQVALGLLRQAQQARRGGADVGIADGQGIDIAGFEVRSDRRREVHGVAAAETAVHALALPQHRIGDFDGTIGRLVTSGRIGTEIDHDRRRWRRRLALQPELRHRQRARETSEIIVDEQPADIVLFEQRLDRALRQLALVARYVDQVRSAVGGNHQIGLGGILAQHAIAGLRTRIVGHARVLVVGIEQRKVERLGEIDGEKAHRQETGRGVVISSLHRGTGLALL